MNNKLFLAIGASGSGKTTAMRKVMSNELISFTTREKRIGEVEGKDYIYISKKEFQKLFDNNGLIEWTEYENNFYGLTRKEFETKLARGNAFFVCDINGAKQMKEIYDNCVSIFFYSEKQEIEVRMRMRGDKEESIQNRLSTYEEEMLNVIYCDEVVINRQGELEETIQKIKDITED